MQFSIFGVPFKCTKDMFTWEKIRSTIFIDWAILWRSYLISLLPGIVIGPILSFLQKDPGVIYFSALFVHLVISFLIYYYSKYTVLYQISFRKFIKEPDSLKFFSGYFWKPVLVSTVLSFLLMFCLILVGVGLWRVLPKQQIGSQALMLLFAIPSALACILLIFDHVFIHGGTYGIIVEPANAVIETLITKKPPIWERIKLSFSYFFTSFWAKLLVYCYVLVGAVIFFAICLAAISSIDLQAPNISQAGSGVVLLGLSITIAAYCFVSYYIEYDVLYKFPYRSVDRLYAPKPIAPKRWSLKFLSTWILAFATKVSIAFAITLFIQFLLDDFVLIDGLVYLGANVLASILFATTLFIQFLLDDFVLIDGLVYLGANVLALILVEISFLSFGAWGFVPVAKQQPTITK